MSIFSQLTIPEQIHYRGLCGSTNRRNTAICPVCHGLTTCDACASEGRVFDAIVHGETVSVCSPACLAFLHDGWTPTTLAQRIVKRIRRAMMFPSQRPGTIADVTYYVLQHWGLYNDAQP